MRIRKLLLLLLQVLLLQGFVVASQRVGAERRPMTGSAKQSILAYESKAGLLRRKCSPQ
jgi:hypothetical protein